MSCSREPRGDRLFASRRLPLGSEALVGRTVQQIAVQLRTVTCPLLSLSGFTWVSRSMSRVCKCKQQLCTTLVEAEAAFFSYGSIVLLLSFSLLLLCLCPIPAATGTTSFHPTAGNRARTSKIVTREPSPALSGEAPQQFEQNFYVVDCGEPFIMYELFTSRKYTCASIQRLTQDLILEKKGNHPCYI